MLAAMARITIINSPVLEPASINLRNININPTHIVVITKNKIAKTIFIKYFLKTRKTDSQSSGKHGLK
jgi:hypothetical protein